MPAAKKKKKTFETAQDDHWVRETKDRLDKVAERLDGGEDKSGPAEQEWMRAGTMDLEKWRLGEPIATESITTVRGGEETAELIYRSSNEGLLATGYNPWRHTTYVTGRPVQVHVECWKPYCQRVCTIRRSILQFVVTLAEAAAQHCVWEPIAPVDFRSLPGDHSGQSTNPSVIP